MNDEVRFIDLFSGIGGFRLGLERAGFKCVWSCDNSRSANEVYHRRFKPKREEHFGGDVRKVNPRNIPDFDILCAGFPCQSFSHAGTRKGFQDTRGTLFFEICRIAEAKEPPLLFLENVRGLLSNKKGETFKIILQSLENLGYWVEWQVFNSRHFVPQNRERVFIIGHLGERGGREVFPIFEYGGVPETERDEGASKVIIFHNVYGGFKEETPRIFENYSPTLRTPKGGGHLPFVAEEKTNFRARVFTPTECERLQGFPDGWTKCGLSDRQKKELLGNAVTVNVIEFLGHKIRSSLSRALHVP